MWKTRWNAISSRIRGLRATVALFFASLNQQGKDLSQVYKTHLIPEAMQIVEALRAFHREFLDVLPPTARGTLESFLQSFDSEKNFFREPSVPALTRATLVLASTQDALEFHLAGSEAVGRSVTERAFEHL